MSTYMNDPGSGDMIQMGREWSPEFGGFLIVMGSAIIAAATSGYLVMAIAFVREHRRRAAADWARARREWDRVTKERADYMALTFAREREALENQRPSPPLCMDSACPGVSFPHTVADHQTRAWGDKVRLIHDMHAGFVDEAELRAAVKSEDLGDFGAAYAAKVMGIRDLTPEDEQQVGRLLNTEECLDTTCPSADHYHVHPLQPEEGT